MSDPRLLIALDPNVCVAATAEIEDPASQDLLDLIIDLDERISIGIDEPKRAILDKYTELAEQMDIRLQKWWAWLLNRRSRHFVFVEAQGYLDELRLDQLGCHTKLEPELLNIATRDGRSKLLVTGKALDSNPLIVPRGVHNQQVVEKLRERYANLTVLPAHSACKFIGHWYGREQRYPETEKEIHDFLRENGFTESDTLEFKQPYRNTERSKGYSVMVVRAVAEAICEFANSYGGTALLGIDELEVQHGVISGFPARYFGRDTTTSRLQNRDEMMRQIVQLLDKYLAPKPFPGYFRTWEIPLSSGGRYVVVFDIKKYDPGVTFEGKKLYRVGPRKQRIALIAGSDLS